jgi:nucleotide-binding universal stress UspA family protein
VLLAVIEDPARFLLAGPDSPDLWLGRGADSLTAGLLKEANARLRSLAEKLGPGCQETIAIKGLVAAREIVRVAQERGSDLIVLATHGRTGVAHARIGSTAERVVREAPSPVLAVRVARRSGTRSAPPGSPSPRGPATVQRVARRSRRRRTASRGRGRRRVRSTGRS